MTTGTTELELPPARVTGLRDGIGLFVILSSISFNMLAVMALLPVLAVIATRFESDPLAVFLSAHFHSDGGQLFAQTLENMSNIGILVGGPIIGWIADRTGRANVLFIALGVFGVAGAAGMFLDYPPALLTSRLLQGFGSAGIAVTTYSLVSERFEGAARSKVMGYQQIFVSLMGFAVLPASGHLADRYGWHAPFGLFLTALIMLPIALATVPRGGALAPHPSSNAQAASEGGSIRALIPIYIMMVPLFIVANMTNLHISFVLAGDGLKGSTAQSYIMMASPIAYLVGGVLYGWVMTPLGPRRMLCLILAILAANGLVIGLSHSALQTAAGVAIGGFASGFLVPFTTNLIVNRAAPEARARALGFMYMANYMGSFLNPWITTPIRTHLGNHEIFLAMGVLLAFVALAQGLTRRSPVNA
ncbi:MAG TPA: MFS transporter [Alphaproteobacteria bacterium]|jgi:MFS family permease|nr:MFS transporter [Alphaproteobacteria bacterium]